MKHSFRTLTLSILAVLFIATGLTAKEYKMDPTHSSVVFKVKHMVISTVTGTFNDVKATLNWDEKNPSKSSFTAEIDVNSIDTKEAKRDGHLKADDFFDVAKYSKITFVSEKITKKGNGFIAEGKLTIKGTTKTVKIPFERKGPIVNPFNKKKTIGFEGEFKLNRKDYGLNFNAMLETGGLVVGDEVKIEISVEGVE